MSWCAATTVLYISAWVAAAAAATAVAGGEKSHQLAVKDEYEPLSHLRNTQLHRQAQRVGVREQQ